MSFYSLSINSLIPGRVKLWKNQLEFLDLNNGSEIEIIFWEGWELKKGVLMHTKDMEITDNYNPLGGRIRIF